MIPSIIPENLSGHEAMLIYDFITAIQDEIWNRYEVQLVELMRAENSTDPADWGYPENSEHLDDEVPF
jgi:hypothetical protein